MTKREIWELINKHGLSIIPDEKDTLMTLVISHKGGSRLESSITLTRKAEPGILFFLPDKEWRAIKGDS